MTLLIIFLILVVLVPVVVLLARTEKPYSSITYYDRAKEMGFTLAEANRIKAKARDAGMADPAECLWHTRDLDIVISGFTDEFRAQKTDKQRDTIAFMEKLYEFRKRLEFDNPQYKFGIHSTKMVKRGQKLRVLIQGLGVHQSTIVDNNERYLVITYPLGVRVEPGFNWKGKKISVYLRRDNDAEYVFDTYVLDEVRINNIPVLQIAHSDSLFRSQKRRSIRMRANSPAYLYLIRKGDTAYERPERIPGLRCIVEDISDDGAAIRIGGKARSGMLVKVQLWINDDVIVLSGTVKGSDYESIKNQSVLHIQALPLSPRMRNLIRSHVYNIREQARREDDTTLLDGNIFTS